MFRHGEYSTEVDKGPFIFTLTGIVSCLAVILVLLFTGDMPALKIMAIVFLLILLLSGIWVMIGLVLDYAYIKDDTLYMHYIFKMRSIKTEDIQKLTVENGIYTVYDRKGEVAGTMNAMLSGIDSVIGELNHRKVSFE
ncbi:MAG: hypothetical protein II780_01685 [Clostridia bacterium]|jgi:hypothetical protein|nr:hypothetical protein [Clostridia bacterium]MBQ4458112.1 hypothetical protein [Clostridia bacterium]MBQ5956184.1 hypothetical protein [Clostridia bacterium]MBQ6004014.1 hypothetical protein [Clostridia bacterium]MBR0438795.1 hypothetical protein [Clostridia bacterium]